jgi:hypothetical protein
MVSVILLGNVKIKTIVKVQNKNDAMCDNNKPHENRQPPYSLRIFKSDIINKNKNITVCGDLKHKIDVDRRIQKIIHPRLRITVQQKIEKVAKRGNKCKHEQG